MTEELEQHAQVAEPASRPLGFRGLHRLIRVLFTVSIALACSSIAVGLFYLQRVSGRFGSARISDTLSEGFGGGWGAHLAGPAIICLLAGTVLFVVAALLQLRHAGRSSWTRRGLLLWMGAIGLFATPFVFGGTYVTTIADFRLDLTHLGLIALATAVSSMVQRRLVLSFVQTNRPKLMRRLNPTLGLAVLVSIAGVAGAAYSIRDAPTPNLAWEQLAYSGEADAEPWDSTYATAIELECLAGAGVNDDAMHVIDELFFVFARIPNTTAINSCARQLKRSVSV